jgi:gamma-D-glutamyl-L-lysine dipeptidyl-peptidase
MKPETHTGQLAVIVRNVANIYVEPKTSTELVTQAIMGQPAWVEKEEGEWSYIRTWDDFHGWVQSRCLLNRESNQPYASTKSVAVITSLFCDVHSECESSSDILTKVVISTELEAGEYYGEQIEVKLPDGTVGFASRSCVKIEKNEEHFPASAEALVHTAKRFIGVPYLWGGTTPFGIDCSGFVQLVFHIHGVRLPRNSYMQAGDPRGIPVNRDELRVCDLLFFAGGTDPEKITHVGMSLGGDQFIQSSGGMGVNITSLQGTKYEQMYWGARRIKEIPEP